MSATAPSPARVLRLIVTGGGTGGHTFPALTTVRTVRAHLAEAGQGLEVLWIGAAGGLEQRVAEAESIPFAAVATGKIRRARNPLKMVSMANLKDMARVPKGLAEALMLVKDFQPDVVLATGGYVAVPVGLAAGALRKPLVVHEQTVSLGLANQLLAKAAACVAVTSESTLPKLSESARRRAVVTGNPVRPEILHGDPGKALDALGLRGVGPGLPTVYITGGAQGALQINSAVEGILPWLLEHALVIHQCGPSNVDSLERAAQNLPEPLRARYRILGFVGAELPDVLALADVVISRSGAGTLAEMTALGKTSVLVPLASAAGNEQALNAQALAEQGAAIAVVGNLLPSRLQEVLAPLLADPTRRQAIATRARGMGKPDAGQRLARAVLQAAGGTWR